jgi:hypothetical protein
MYSILTAQINYVGYIHFFYASGYLCRNVRYTFGQLSGYVRYVNLPIYVRYVNLPIHFYISVTYACFGTAAHTEEFCRRYTQP